MIRPLLLLLVFVQTSVYTGACHGSDAVDTSAAIPANMAVAGAMVGADLSKLNVAFAGFAMAGAANKLQQLYPYTAALEKELVLQLRIVMGKLKPDSYVLHTQQLLDADHGNSVSLAFVIDHEKVSIEEINGVYKLLLEVSGQAVVFDFAGSEGAIIASYPIALPPYIEVFARAPQSVDIQPLIMQYYLGGLVDMPGLIRQFARTIESIPIKQKYASEIGVGGIFFAPEAKAALPSAQQSQLDALSFSIGRRLASELAVHQKVSVVPRFADASVARMAVRFTGDKSATYLRLPQPEYFIDLAILKLDAQVYSRNATGTSIIYHTEARIRVRSQGPLDDLVVLDQSFLHGVAKAVPKTQDSVDDWAARQASLHGLLQRFAQEINDPSKEWIARQKLAAKEITELAEFQKVLQQCR